MRTPKNQDQTRPHHNIVSPSVDSGLAGRPYTGRHWWGPLIGGVPEPLLGQDAADVAQQLGLPARDGVDTMGTTVVVSPLL